MRGEGSKRKDGTISIEDSDWWLPPYMIACSGNTYIKMTVLPITKKVYFEVIVRGKNTNQVRRYETLEEAIQAFNVTIQEL